MEILLKYALTADVKKASLKDAARVWAEIKGRALAKQQGLQLGEKYALAELAKTDPPPQTKATFDKWINEIDSYIPLDSIIPCLKEAISENDEMEDLCLKYICEYFLYFLSQHQSAVGLLEENEMEILLKCALTANLQKANVRFAARVWAEIKGRESAEQQGLQKGEKYVLEDLARTDPPQRTRATFDKWISKIESYVPLKISIQYLKTAISQADNKEENVWLKYICEYFRYFQSQYQTAFGLLEANEMEMLLKYAVTAGVGKAYLKDAARVWTSDTFNKWMRVIDNYGESQLGSK